VTGGAAWWDGLPGDLRYLGIGSATSMALAGVGAEIGIVARDRIRGETTVAELRALGGDGDIDLLWPTSPLRRRSALWQQTCAPGGIACMCRLTAVGPSTVRRETLDALDRPFALNHLAYFFSRHRFPTSSWRGRRLGSSRRLGWAQSVGRIDFDDLQKQRRYGVRPPPTNPSSPTCSSPTSSPPVAGHRRGHQLRAPGVVRSGFGRDDQPLLWRLMMPIVTPFMRDPVKGAETVDFLACSPEVEGVTGKYFHDKEPKRSSVRSYDTEVAARLWKVSEQLTSEPIGKGWVT
jgi:retinol dehydrogenase 14